MCPCLWGDSAGRWCPDEKGDWIHNMPYVRFSASTSDCGACPLFRQARVVVLPWNGSEI